MKSQTTVTVSQEEIQKMISKYVEKKLAKKVVDSSVHILGDNTFNVKYVLEEIEIADKE
jgi:hypothetical protein